MSVLREPTGTPPPPRDAVAWRIEAATGAVRKGWEKTIRADPKGAARAYAYLRDQPFLRHPGRCFPLRGHAQKGVWQYEVNATYRIRYSALKDRDRVLVVVYAGDYH